MSSVSDTSYPPAPGDLGVIQALVNTLDVESGKDGLDAPDGVPAFTARHGLPPLGDEALPAVRELREHLRDVLLAHTTSQVPPDRLDALTRRFDTAPVVLRLDAYGAATLEPAPGLDGMATLTARVAAAVALAQATGTWRRLKVCEAHDCLWAYYDRSPGGRRRWCSMQICGARHKMRTYRTRQRG